MEKISSQKAPEMSPEIAPALKKFEQLKQLIWNTSEPVFMESGSTTIKAWISKPYNSKIVWEEFHFRKYMGEGPLSKEYPYIEADVTYDSASKSFRYSATRNTGDFSIEKWPWAWKTHKQFGGIMDWALISPDRAEKIIDAMIEQINSAKKGKIVKDTKDLLVQNFPDSPWATEIT